MNREARKAQKGEERLGEDTSPYRVGLRCKRGPRARMLPLLWGLRIGRDERPRSSASDGMAWWGMAIGRG